MNRVAAFRVVVSSFVCSFVLLTADGPRGNDLMLDAIAELREMEKTGDVRLIESSGDLFIGFEERADEACRIAATIDSFSGFTEYGSLSSAGMEALKNHPRLQEISLRSSSIDESGFAVLPTLKRLRKLNITIKRSADFGCGSIGKCENLEYLSFNGGNISDAGLKEFGGLTKLKELDLTLNKVANELSVVANMGALRKLNLDSTCVDDQAVKSIEGLRNLEWLSLAGTKITDEAGICLQEFKTLTNLDLSDTDITDLTGTTLAELRDLENLYLPGTKITAKTIVALKKLDKLQTLSIHKVVLDRPIADALAELHLKTLFIGGNKYMQITQSEGEALMEKLKPGHITFLDR